MSYIDTRDLDTRRDELTDIDDRPLTDEEAEELREINVLADTIGSEFVHGVTLIPEYMFEAYAEELAEDIYGAAVTAAHWPLNCIDWERAANELRYDYSSVDFDGETYLYRSC